MANKVTKRDVFNAVLDMIDGATPAVSMDDIKAAMEHEIELLNKKSAKASGPNPEFAEIEDKILAFLDGVGAKATADIANGVGISTQKAAPRLTALVDAGKVVKSTAKGKNYFEVA